MNLQTTLLKEETWQNDTFSTDIFRVISFLFVCNCFYFSSKEMWMFAKSQHIYVNWGNDKILWNVNFKQNNIFYFGNTNGLEIEKM